jgi:alpha-L-rhamnosidase
MSIFSVDHLRCEHLQNPLGLGVERPRLSWKLQASHRGARQSAYQILVASSAELLARDEADLWNSDKVDSDQSVQVSLRWADHRFQCSVPGGKCALGNENDNASEYSQSAWWKWGCSAKNGLGSGSAHRWLAERAPRFPCRFCAANLPSINPFVTRACSYSAGLVRF